MFNFMTKLAGAAQKRIQKILSSSGERLSSLISRIRIFPKLILPVITSFLEKILIGIRAAPFVAIYFFQHLGDYLTGFLSMLVVVLKRMRHNLGITISAIIGILAILALVVCIPLFSNAVSGEVLHQQLVAKAALANRRLFSIRMYFLDNLSSNPVSVDITNKISEAIKESAYRLMGLKVEQIITEIQSGSMGWNPVKTKYHLDPKEVWFSMNFFSLVELPKHSSIIEGRWPDVVSAPNQPIQVAISDVAADDLFVNVGDIYTSQNQQVEIVGIWKANSEEDPYWFSPPGSAYSKMMWITLQTFQARMGTLFKRPVYYASWYVIMNESDLQFRRAPEYAKGIVQMNLDLKKLMPVMINDYTPVDELNQYQERDTTLTTLYYAVGSPMVLLALLFVSLTATIAAQQYEQETATMRGRGASSIQIVGLDILESGVLILLAFLPSLVLGWFGARIIEKSLSFLQFTNRADIPFSFQGFNFGWMGLAALVIVVSRLMPVLNGAGTTIVHLKQEQSRNSRKPLWQRFYLDFLLLLPGLYAYATMSGVAKSNQLISKIPAPSTGQYRDILLYLAPALFAIAMCMIMLRIVPLLLRVLASIANRFHNVWAYLSIQQIARRPQDHSSALLLIMISLSLAIFSASTAKTLDRWLHDAEYYKSGADLAVHEYILKDGSKSFTPGISTDTTSTLTEYDANIDSTINLEEHLKLPSVEAVTRVGKYAGTFSYGAGDLPVHFMGIDRLDYPQVGFFRNDFSGQTFGALMNDLGIDLNAVLVPSSLAKEKGFRIGDHLQASINILGQTFEKDLVITGFYDYFATVFPGDDPTLIMNLDSIFDNPDSAIGYDIWLKLKPDSDVKLVIYQLQRLIGADKSVVQIKGNAFQDVIDMMAKPERVGIFGVLNVGFLMTGLMPALGFVLYSFASLRRRFVQLGILQAIGLSFKHLIAYLASEQFILMGVSILSGAAIGLWVSYLFVPFLQIGVSTGNPIPPFEVLIGWVESGVLSLVFGLVLFLTMAATVANLVKMKVFQAVKMGETL